MRSLSDFLGKRSVLFIITSGFSLVLFIGFLDYLTGTEINISAFYLLPISMGVWFSGRRIGYLLALTSAFVWTLSDMLLKKGSLHPAVYSWNFTITLSIFTVVVYLLSILKSSLETEKELSRTDPLTSIGNRRYFVEAFDQESKRFQRYGHPFSVAYMDIDDFKSINDRQGHLAGDNLLKSVAETIKLNTRTTDIASRLGGDEFAILFPETDAEAIKSLIESLHEALTECVLHNGWPVTFSIGVVTFVEIRSTIEEMISIADGLMYSVKKSGKNMITHRVII